MGSTLRTRAALLATLTAAAACSASVTPPDADRSRPDVPLARDDAATTAPDAAVPTDAPAGDATVLRRPDAGQLDDLIVRGVNLAQYEGRTLHLALRDNDNMLAARAAVVVTGGAFTATWPRAFDRDLFGMIVYVFYDRDGDSACSAADPLWQLFVNNSFRAGMPETADFDPAVAPPADAAECRLFR